ncbi:hypothetical protein QTN47_17025 [Danxiaibacter flavus]|uniref:Uncharacterized protein n=1 Tax=Danxiaibacter flavus TaxID=3049108 RepID=A0ABV3ZI70_9BACT|nr:hypothetical protein QNM32_17035 [Chitinophagaceae bacterium DXS]
MEWRFTIIDRDNNKTVIDEPVGWNDIKFKLSRDKDMHGLFYDYTANSFEFWGPARTIIKQEYETYGLEGVMFLQAEYQCHKGWLPFTTGRIIFANYSESTGSDCFVKAGIDNISEIVTLKNRIEQSVDLLSLKAFDDVTDLDYYSTLKKNIELPSKAIPLTTKAMNESSLVSENFTNNSQWFTNTGGSPQMRAQFIPGFTKTISTTVNESTIWNTAQMINGGFNGQPATGLMPLIDFKQLDTPLKCISSQMHVKFRMKGSVAVAGGSLSGGQLQLMRLGAGKDPAVATNYDRLADNNILFSGFDISHELDVAMDVGDQLWLYIFIFATNPDGFTNFTITESPECFIELSLISKCDPTHADVFMINEALSRTIENITNNKMKLYSEYFGRPDSQPFAMDLLGRGSLEAITSGLKIRRVVSKDGTDKQFFVNLKQLFNDLSAIHCLGMGIQSMEDNFDLTDDLTNMYNPYYLVRIEDWKWFYKDNVIFTCSDVDGVTKQIVTDKHIAKFVTGYEKWEAEQESGLDEFLTKRSYATQLTQVDNSLEKVCKMIASGYALEFTRRQDQTNTDWRYDNETFIICLNSDFTAQVGGIDNPENIVDPDTVYNFRISPTRNLMRWFAYIISSYRDAAGKKIKFTAGDGNLVAKGQQSAPYGKMDNAPLQENQDIDASIFFHPEYSTPILRNETVQFSYPLTAAGFKNLINNPYGLISWTCKKEKGSGWISEITYEPNTGIASFTLIPKIES